MTFHALGLLMLREHGERLGLQQPIRVASRAECLRLLQDALDLSDRKAGQLLTRISRHKRQEHAVGRDVEPGVEVYEAINEYDGRLRTRGLVDFDDLVVLPVRLLETFPDLVETYRARFRWISVDEYQDVDHFQYRLIRLLVPEDGNLCVIGDPDQAIYGFRGAEVGYFQRFRDDFPTAKTISLVRNYRSTNMIVDASVQLISPASLVADRTLHAQVESLDHIEIHECSTDRAEAEFVVHCIEKLIGGSTFFSMDSGRVRTHDGQTLSFSDVAVLYRTDSQADAIVEAFARSGMPFQKRSHVALTEQSGVQKLTDAMSQLPETLSVPDRLEQAAECVHEDQVEMPLLLPALRLVACRHEQSFAQFLSELALGCDVDLWDERADRVSLLTIHAAKGLEFPVVFITGCEDGLIPLHWGSHDIADLAEERRLLFVGMTRAQNRLFLTHARKRVWRGKPRKQEISPFLHDIQERLLSRHQHQATRKRRRRPEQPTLFQL
jgi:superfamily I DNA/RNA helicase